MMMPNAYNPAGYQSDGGLLYLHPLIIVQTGATPEFMSAPESKPTSKAPMLTKFPALP